MSLISTILQPLLALLGAKFGAIGVFGAYALAFVPVMTLIIELLQFVVSLTSSVADDKFAQSVTNVWETYILPVLEVIPHSNIPISATMMTIIGYVNKGAAAIMAAVKAWMNPPAPPAPPSA